MSKTAAPALLILLSSSKLRIKVMKFLTLLYFSVLAVDSSILPGNVL